MYEKFDDKNPNIMSWPGTGISTCNGCGKEVQESDEMKHYSECTISQMRVGLDIKSRGKIPFTKVRE